jgi:hypothetical protein
VAGRVPKHVENPEAFSGGEIGEAKPSPIHHLPSVSNVAYQPRCAPRAVGCMRLFGELMRAESLNGVNGSDNPI